METEIWKVIPGYPQYEASSEGRIKSYKKGRRGRILKPILYANGRYKINVFGESTGPRGKIEYVHRLVCAAFNGPASEENWLCRHLDGDHQNNRPQNLRWGSSQQNHDDMTLHGTRAMGESSGVSKLTELQVREIKMSNLSLNALAFKFGVSDSTIADIRKERTWNHINFG